MNRRAFIALLLFCANVNAFDPDEIAELADTRWRQVTTTIPEGVITTPEYWLEGWKTRVYVHEGFHYRLLMHKGSLIEHEWMTMRYYFRPVWGVDLTTMQLTDDLGRWVEASEECEEDCWTYFAGARPIFYMNMESECPITARVTSDRQYFVMRKCGE